MGTIVKKAAARPPVGVSPEEHFRTLASWLPPAANKLPARAPASAAEKHAPCRASQQAGNSWHRSFCATLRQGAGDNPRLLSAGTRCWRLVHPSWPQGSREMTTASADEQVRIPTSPPLPELKLAEPGADGTVHTHHQGDPQQQADAAHPKAQRLKKEPAGTTDTVRISQPACYAHSQQTVFPDSERLLASQILKPELDSLPSSACCLQPGSKACLWLLTGLEADQEGTQVRFGDPQRPRMPCMPAIPKVCISFVLWYLCLWLPDMNILSFQVDSGCPWKSP